MWWQVHQDPNINPAVQLLLAVDLGAVNGNKENCVVNVEHPCGDTPKVFLARHDVLDFRDIDLSCLMTHVLIQAEEGLFAATVHVLGGDRILVKGLNSGTNGKGIELVTGDALASLDPEVVLSALGAQHYILVLGDVGQTSVDTHVAYDWHHLADLLDLLLHLLQREHPAAQCITKPSCQPFLHHKFDLPIHVIRCIGGGNVRIHQELQIRSPKS